MTGWPRAARCEAWDGATTVSCERPNPQNLSTTILVGGIPLPLSFPHIPQTATPSSSLFLKPSSLLWLSERSSPFFLLSSQTLCVFSRLQSKLKHFLRGLFFAHAKRFFKHPGASSLKKGCFFALYLVFLTY